MFTFLKNLFSGKKQEIQDPDLTAEELWQTDFRKPATARFAAEEGDAYSTKLTPRGLALSLGKKNVYAWTVDPVYRYQDFVVETLIEFVEPAEKSDRLAGTMAAGVFFRYLNDSTFYAVLVSDHGMVRMDAVVNGTPMPVLGWTEIRETDGSTTDDDESGDAPYRDNPAVRSLRVIAQGTSFTIIVNDAWVAECADDTIQAPGRIAFAAQNWAVRDRAGATLRAIAVDSRPIEVETVYTRWNQYIKIPPEAHISLAHTWYAMGKYVPAILELKRAWKNREPGSEELLLSGQIYLAQRLLPEAEEQIRKVLSADVGNGDALAELAGILYLQNRFIDLDDLLGKMERKAVESSPFLSNIEGHLLHWKGEHDKAAEAYHRAAVLAPDQGLFPMHEGNEWKESGKTGKAVEAWLEAARVFLAAEEYDDLSRIIPELGGAAGDDVRVLGITGKYLYAIDESDKAYEALGKAVRKNTGDSAVWYLYGMLAGERGNTAEALDALRAAVNLEPEYGPYRFRLAETLFFAGENCEAELEKALETDDGNGWAHNLAALKALGENDVEAAERHIIEARRLLPDELPVLVNFAEIKRRQGKLDEALPLLDSDDCDKLRAGANLLVEAGRHEEADDWYIRALKHRPSDGELLTDRAANCLELDLLNEADDLLGKAIEAEPSPRIFSLIGYLAGRKGEFARAEIALQQGLEVFPGNADLLYELGGLYLTTNKPKKAAEAVERLKETENSERVSALETEIAEISVNRIFCAVCGKTWRVPKDIPAQGSLHITAQPPDDLPAGTCPSCQEHYCIGCAKENLGEDGRFRCRKCGQPLKLIDQNVIWLLNRWQDTQR